MASAKNPDPGKAKSIDVRELAAADKPVRRTFPGPRDPGVKLRVAVERSAHADLIAHAKSSLKAEVCGVLAGQVCEDDEGVFVAVEAAIPGTAAGEGMARVTFTQETWNAIHKTLERDHPKLKIVGWYHTHPGFGVEFSEMDLFIQRNFFPGPTHLALVTDPLSGDVAICMNAEKGIEYLERFWVDGREQQTRVPARMTTGVSDTAPAAGPDKLRTLEERVSQLVQSLDELRTFHYRFMLTCGFAFCLALMAAAGYSIYEEWSSRLEPPKVNQVVPIPVQVGDKTVILGVGITSWEVPPELDAMMLKAAKLESEAVAKADGTNTVDGVSTNSNTATNSKTTNAP
jgi:proteasome lid subunit RPN8/RPN11